MAGAFVAIIMKSENAKLTTKRLDGVRSVLVVVNMRTTQPFPMIEMAPIKWTNEKNCFSVIH